MNSQFKFKPDKIKYLSNFDTLDSSHKKIIDNINKKREDVPIKINKLNKLNNQLEELDLYNNLHQDYISIRAKIIEEISCIKEELKQIENYEEETEYYSKIYKILFNYYDILDGQIDNEINTIDNSELNAQSINIDTNDESNNIEIIKNDDSNDENLININIENNNINNDEIINNSDNNNYIDKDDKNIDEWNFDGIKIFNSIKSDKLDILNEISRMKRKEKKTTRKRIKNVDSLIKENNYNIFDFINSNTKNTDNPNLQIEENINDINNKNISNDDNYDIKDRAILYEDYKTLLEGYTFKKKNSKPCINCNLDKILVYSEGIYACMKCGEVENCIVESDIVNYKDPMIEKPTFPYKRKNHFCERNYILLLVKVTLKKVATLYLI